MDALSFIESPPKEVPQRVAVIFGDEDFLRRRSLEVLRELVLGGGEEYGLARFSGQQAELAQVLDELRTRPMFGSRRLVIVEDGDDFVSRHRERLEAYVKGPSPWGVLVLLVKSWPSTTRLAKLVASQGLPLECRAPKAYEVARWLGRWASRAYQKKLAPAAAEMMVEWVGTSLGVLDQELDKLAAGVGERKQITEEDVDRLVVGSAVRTIWQMLDALSEGRTADALKTLDGLLLRGEEPVAILGALSWHLRALARAARLASGGQPLRAALQEAGVKPFAVDRAQTHLRRLGPARAGKLYDWLLEADLDLKGQRAASPQLVLETLVARLAGG